MDGNQNATTKATLTSGVERRVLGILTDIDARVVVAFLNNINLFSFNILVNTAQVNFVSAGPWEMWMNDSFLILCAINFLPRFLWPHVK